MTTDRYCGACFFWEPDRKAPLGICRRSPPAREIQGEAWWPATSASDWCGEFRKHSRFNVPEEQTTLPELF